MSLSTERVYTLSDLKSWSQHFPSDHTALAVIGHPIAHSLSPVMHNAALAELAKKRQELAKWRYFKFVIAPEQLEEALYLFREKNFLGLNLTVPHKTLVLEHIDTEVTTVEEAGAANTLKWIGTKWKGFNTDGYGLHHALAGHSVDIKDADVILLGAGGAARSAALECLVSQCASLHILNRTASTAHALISHLKKSTAYISGTELIIFNPADHALPTNSLVINATSLGLKESDESPIDLTKIPRPAFVFDMIYRPAQTRLLKQAAEMGIPNTNGLSMLVYQGASSLEHWIESPLPFDVLDLMHRTVRDALK